MVNVTIARGWDLTVERGPEMLLVHPRPSDASTPSDAARGDRGTSLAEQVWSLLEQSLTHRLVLVLDDVGELDSHLIDQLEWLRNRIHASDGIMRLCGLSPENIELLKASELDGHFACYHDRDEAVMGHPRTRLPR